MEEENHFEHVKKYFEKLVLVILESRIPDEKQTKCENFNLITTNKPSIIQSFETIWEDLQYFKLEKNDKLLISLIIYEKNQESQRTLEYWELSYELDEENTIIFEDINFINLIRQIYLKSRLMPAYKYSKEHKKRPQESKIEYSISMGSHVNPSSLISGEIPFSFPPVNASGGAFEVDVLFLKNLQNFSSRVIPLNDFLIAESYHPAMANNKPAIVVDTNPQQTLQHIIDIDQKFIDSDEEDDDDIPPVDIAESLRNFSAALLSPPSLNLFETAIATKKQYTKQDVANFRIFYDKVCAQRSN